MESSIPSNKLKEFLLLVKQGDEYAYRKIFDAYKTQIYSTIYNLSDDEFIAEEVLQETFIRIWNYREKLDSVVNFDSWIYRVAKNVFLTKLKNSKPLHEPLDIVLHDMFVEPIRYDDLEFRELQNTYDQVIANLPVKQRLTYQLIKVEGMSRKEVAKVLNVSAETVKWNLDEAVKKVRSTMIEVLKNLPLVFILYYLQKK